MSRMDHIFVIFLAGILAGAMNALAGGGSFVTLPTLIAAGVPSVQANATSTIALFPASIVSAWVYREELGPVGPVALPRLMLATLAGGMVGAILLLYTPTEAFDSLLPWLLLLACVALACGRRLRESGTVSCIGLQRPVRLVRLAEIRFGTGEDRGLV